MRLFLLLLWVGPAHGDTILPAPIAPIRGGEHPGFRAWAQTWARSHHGTVDNWWSGDLDGDGEADDVATLCVSTDDGGVYLIEDAKLRRFAAAFDNSTWFDEHPNCVASRPRFETTSRRVVRYDPDEKRAHNSSELALRDGKLVVVTESEGGGRCTRQDDVTLDWNDLIRSETHTTSQDCEAYQTSKRDEAILLVGHATPTFFSVVQGKWRGASDASLQVTVTQPDAQQLLIRVGLSDDLPVRAAARSQEALAAADHLQVWIGSHSLRLARDSDGNWFSLPKAKVKGNDSYAQILVPIDWLDWMDGPVGTTAKEARISSLVVAFADIDSSGDRKVISTAPIPRHGEPRGFLLQLPDNARWPTAGFSVYPIDL